MTDRHIVLTGRTDLTPGEVFTLQGRTWQAVTYPVGAKKEYAPGIVLDVGMWNDPEYPLPDGAITAVRKDLTNDRRTAHQAGYRYLR